MFCDEVGESQHHFEALSLETGFPVLFPPYNTLQNGFDNLPVSTHLNLASFSPSGEGGGTEQWSAWDVRQNVPHGCTQEGIRKATATSSNCNAKIPGWLVPR